MTSTRSALWRCVTIAGMTVLSSCIAAPAHAVSPPPVDHTRLPPPAPAGPPQATVQREICAVPALLRDAATGQLAALDLPQVWRLTRGAGQRVAVIDTGVTPNPRLPHLAPGGDYVSSGDGTQDCDGHGTAVAGIIAATESPTKADEFTGVAPDVALIGIRQSSAEFGTAAQSAASGYGDVSTLARAVRTAADMEASVINISSVACAPADPGLDDRALGAALSYAVDTKDVVVVTAAGNVGSGQCQPTVVVSPAWYDDYVLTVGSVNPLGDPSSFTLAGPWVDVAAPGEAVISLGTSGGLANALNRQRGTTPLAGTSYAAPVVSGLAALIRARFPHWTARQVMQRIKSTAHHPPGGWDPRVGAGTVDLLAAVSTDSTPTPLSPAARVSAPLAAPIAASDDRARRTALHGATVSGSALATLLCLRTVRMRRRRPDRSDRNILRH